MSDTPFLLDHHRQLIEASAITDEVALARGYRSVTTKAELRRLGFADSQCRVPALLVPVWNVHGEIASYQIRPDAPRIVRGKPIKYETPKGAAMVVDVPPASRARLGDPAIPLLITEGIRKADSAASHGLCCIALLGVWNFRGTNAHGGKTVLPDFGQIALNGRDVFLGFDSDVITKPPVRAALDQLSDALASRAARVRPLLLPMGEGGAKTGLDDYLAGGHTTIDLFALAVERLPGPVPEAGSASPGGPYRIVDGTICWVRPSGDEEAVTRLGNFTAEIVEEVIADDGQSEQGELVIRGRLDTDTTLPEIRVPTSRYDSLQWVTGQWGVRAIIAAGHGARDRLREAIQRLSPATVVRREYTHPGWRLIDGTWCFLTQETVIGPDGPVDGVVVRLDGPAGLIRLGVPPAPDDLPLAVTATLRLLDLAPDRIMIPLLGGVFRAVLRPFRPVDVVLYLVGPSGAMKSELAAAIQRCFGPGVERQTLPASWSSTSNALERVAFDFKDCVVVIDDFAPAGSRGDRDRFHLVADRVIRSAGNGTGRSRMQADNSLRPSLPPRALILGTGEDVPSGYSILARMVVLHVEPGNVDGRVLGWFQTGEGREQPTQMLAGFVQWIAGRFETLRQTFGPDVLRLRDDLRAGSAHARTPDALAGLGAAWRVWLAFARETGALTPAESDRLWERVVSALDQLARAQVQYLAQEHPVDRFLELLRAVLASGAAHVAGPDGQHPAVTPDAWGWRKRSFEGMGVSSTEWQPQGERIGWIDGDGLYLQPQAAYQAVQRYGAIAGSGIAISAPILWKRLDEAKLLRSTDYARRRTRQIRKHLGGARQYVLHLAPAVLDAAADGTGPEEADFEPRTEPPAGSVSAPGQVEAAGQHRSASGATADSPHPAEGPRKPAPQQDNDLAGQEGQRLPAAPRTGATTCARCGIRRTVPPASLCPRCADDARDPAA